MPRSASSAACCARSLANTANPWLCEGPHAMYLDALEFLDEEREAWAPFEALGSLSDEQLDAPVEAAHGWSGRQLMGHLLGWQDNAMAVAKELAVGEMS